MGGIGFQSAAIYYCFLNPEKKEENIVLESSSCPLHVLEPFPSRKWSTCCCKMLAASHSKYVTVWKLEKYTLSMLQTLLRENDLYQQDCDLAAFVSLRVRLEQISRFFTLCMW